MFRLVAVFLLLSNTVSLTPQQQAHVKHLEDSLLAPCCYSQSVAQHMSGAAAQMREEITAMVASGMTEQQIIDRYKAIYGDQILIVPDGRTGKILFSMPVVIFLSAIAILLLVLRRMLRGRSRAPALSTPPTAPQNPFHDQIERETGDIV